MSGAQEMQRITAGKKLSSRCRDRSKGGLFTMRYTIGLSICIFTLFPQSSNADEAGVSFWLPGFFGSLAATPLVPGFAIASVSYHTPMRAAGDVTFARQVARGDITGNFNGNLNAHLAADVTLVMTIPSYTFAQPFLGGQASVSLAIPYGYSRVGVDATLTGTLDMMPGFTISGSRTDTVTGFGDLIPQFNVRWNSGSHNFMTYLSGNLTVGAYDPTRFANIGIGHNVIDAGGAYSYFNPQTGREWSATLGFTYNFENPRTQYQNGIDMHLDVGASQFVTKQLQIGLVGYAYQQLSCDSGVGNRLGCFESRVFGIGPQIG